ncbi:hypothetical protein DSM112329_00996 [Paraconexibacter sp. AEG42_29]|uniref:MBL fold metallo-hydrolase n=1 Tax=Paraconexibacter sp. AEG42_29 TaxID=2997339 RepID=A0AAU7ARP9_9ACTN
MTAITRPAPSLDDLRPVPDLDAARAVWPRGRRLDAVRTAGLAFKEHFKAQGTVLGVRSVNLVTAPYPTTFAFHGAVRLPTPYVFITNRMVVVQYEDFAGVRRTLVWEPTLPEGSVKAPFYAQTAATVDRIPGGQWLADNVLTITENDTDDVLRACGLRAEDVDYVSFDHLHVQDVRMVLGTTAPIPGEDAPREPLFPNALVLAQETEIATLEDPHPTQWPWYVPDTLVDARVERFGRLQGSVELGVGVAIVWTPGHTDGNHSLVVNTEDGVWVSSENGVALDNWQPELSRIPGIAHYARFYQREIVPNANTLEDFQDQYDSMVLEKTLADPCRDDPRWRQVIPSSELADIRRQWPVRPTYRHAGMNYGTLLAT